MFPLDFELSPMLVLKNTTKWAPLVFRTLSLMVIAPIIFFAVLDITAYAIARTVGQPHSHRNRTTVTMGEHVSPPTINVTLADCDLLASPLVSKTPLDGKVPLSPGSTIQVSTPLIIPADFSHHFSTPSDGNLALAGHGIFSPPESRAGSPTLERKSLRMRSGSTATTSESETESSQTLSSSQTTTSPGDSYISSPKTDGNGSLRHRANHLKLTPMNVDAPR